MNWVKIEQAKLQNNMKADLYCVNPFNGYGGRQPECIFINLYGKDAELAWVNMNGAPVENANRKITHIMIIEDPKE